MNESTCDIHDVTRSASDLVAVGCSIGMAQIPDSIERLRFGSIVSAYADEIIQAVDEGLISAWDGLQRIGAENEELISKAAFYAQNGINVLAGGAQIKAGVVVGGASWGVGIIPGALLVSHGANNIAEGAANIYNGLGITATQGPIRRGYQALFRDSNSGNMAYYTTDLILSGYGMFRVVRKPGSAQLFRFDPISNERGYQQTGRLALLFEGIVDSITLKTIYEESQPKGSKP